MREIHDLVQGTEEWLAFRAERLTASDASAMLGISSYKSRDELLAEKATGITPEVDSRTQARFDEGHRLEELARPIAEKIIGDDLWPATVSLDTEGLKLAASCDGLTMDDETIFEHKTLNANLEASLKAGVIPEQYHPQLEQQMLVTGASRALFMASKGTEETALYVWYESNDELRQRIIDGWKQFVEDRNNYQAKARTQEVKGSAPSDLMPIYADVLGEVKATNLPEVKERAMAVFGSINRDLQTDEDFANAEATVKWCKATEEKLAAAKESALAKTQTIAELFSTIDYIGEESRKIRLELDKLVKERKQQRKMEIATAAKKALDEYIAKLNTERCQGLLPTPPADFNGAMKGKRTIATLQDAADNEVARVKIMAKQTAELIEQNLGAIDSENYGFLFRDLPQLVLRDHDFVKLTVKDRVEKHKAEEEARVEAEAQRRADEKIKAERAEQQRKEEEKRKAEQSAQPQSEPAPSAQPAVQRQPATQGAPAATSHVETQTDRPAKLKTPLSEYERGFIDGLCSFEQWSKEGLTLEQAIERFTRQQAA